MTMTRTLAIAISMGWATAAATTFAADYEAGKKKAEEVCGACHGADGNKSITPDTPRLAGQHYEYLIAALKQYQKGERQNPMMTPMAKPLTKEEIKNVALYFSKQKGLSAKY
jgi:cytochrome c553